MQQIQQGTEVFTNVELQKQLRFYSNSKLKCYTSKNWFSNNYYLFNRKCSSKRNNVQCSKSNRNRSICQCWLRNNCDSTVTVNLNVIPAKTGSVTTTICSTGSVVVNGTTYNAANPTGTEVFTNVSQTIATQQ